MTKIKISTIQRERNERNEDDDGGGRRRTVPWYFFSVTSCFASMRL